MSTRHLCAAARAFLLLHLLLLGACSSCNEEVITTKPPSPMTSDMDAPDMAQEADQEPEAPEATRIEIQEARVTLEVGKERALSFEVFDQNDQPITPLPIVMWSSSDRGVANSVAYAEEKRLVIRAVSVGMATLRAQTLSGASATIEVEVTPRVPVRIDVSPDAAEVLQRDTVQLTARVFAEDDFELLDREVTWSSQDDDVATVNPAGLVTGQRPGSTQILAELDGLSTTTSITVLPRQPDRVQILTPPLDLLVNDTAQLEAVVRDDRGGVLDDLAITWRIDDDEIADLDPDTGALTAKKAGVTTITATHEMRSATLSLEVQNRPITSIDILPDMTTLLLGESVQMNAMVFADDGSAHPEQGVSWSLQPATSTSISISPDGLVTALGVGTTSVIASSESAPNITSQPSFITVVAAVDAITISPASLTMIVGDRLTLTAQTFDQNNTELFRQVMWQSADPTIAAVDPNGQVAALAQGSTQISASADGTTASITVTVNPVPVARIEVLPSLVTLLPSDTFQFTVQAFDANDNLLSGRAVSWQSSDPVVASIEATTGLATGAMTGRATITATVEGQMATARVVVPVRFEDVVAGGSHTCAMTTGGEYYCFGRNQFDVLGLTGNMDRLFPELVSIPQDGFMHISSLTLHQCALTPQGKLFCWGANFAGQLGIGTSTGSTPSPTAIEPARNFSQVSTGGAHTCAIEDVTRKVFCWGSNDYGQLGLGSTNLETSPVEVPGPRVFSQVSTGGSHTCAIEDVTQKLYCWGRNDAGQLGIDNMSMDMLSPTEVDNARAYVAVSAGPEHTCAITTMAETYCWGGNSDGQLGQDTGGVDSVTHLLVPGNLSFASIDAASLHTCALTQTGQMHCWGANNNGQLGDGTTTSSAAPVAVSGNLTFTKMDLGGIHTCALTDTQLVYCWGSGSNGRLGNGTLAGSTTPYPLTLGP